MGKILCLIVGLLISFGASATQITYTFEGQIREIYDEKDLGVAQSLGLNVGTTVNYQVLVDFDARASYTHIGGITTSWNSNILNENSFYENYYADLLSGPELTTDYEIEYKLEEKNHAFSYEDIYGSSTRLFVGSGLGMEFLLSDTLIQDIQIGQYVELYDVWIDYDSATGLEYYGYIYADLQVTDIVGDVNNIPIALNARSIPLPSSLYLFGVGLIGLCWRGYQKKEI
ncbi:MAG: PEP-CTERM sorting domain-containing protein [Gammaproteobacteria bacterium]|nr:PEP-CTERM sorting domain-containing protein [Gammaproteobacteria bacterium]